MKWYIHPEPLSIRDLGPIYGKLQAAMHRYYYVNKAIHICNCDDMPVWMNEPSKAVLRDFDLWKAAIAERDKQTANISMHNVKRRAVQMRLQPQVLIDLCQRMLKSGMPATSLGTMAILIQNIARTRKCEETFGLMDHVLTAELKSEEARQDAARDPKLETIDRYLESHIHEMVTSLDIANFLHLNPS